MPGKRVVVQTPLVVLSVETRARKSQDETAVDCHRPTEVGGESAASGNRTAKVDDRTSALLTEGQVAPDRRAERSPPTPLTPAEIEERTENLAERREKLDYFYISASTAILVFTFNNFNSRLGILARAPIWLVELGWGSLIAAIMCPLYVISVRFKRFAINLDQISGKEIDRHLFFALRRRGRLAHSAMNLLFLLGVVVLCIAYAIGLNHLKA